MAELREPEEESLRSPRHVLSDQQRLARLRLIRSENIGPVTYNELLGHFGDASEALEALPELARRGGGRRMKICPIEDAEAELERASRIGAKVIAMPEPGYPPRLAQIADAPPLLVVKGELGLADRPIVAIVGARNGSAIGQKFTRRLAQDLGDAGFAIASGLARGIDTAAHRAALGRGTIAVVAGGIDAVYPPENEDLQSEIGTSGLLISERATGYRPRGSDFPRRNRLVSGMSLGVVVVEAAQRSGSLITARLAGEQGREVFAVPGSPLDPRAAGTNRLIKNGATVVTGARDVIDALRPILGRRDDPSSRGLDDHENSLSNTAETTIGQTERQRVLEAIGFSPVDVDEVIRVTGLSARQVQVVLLELDLAGRLERHGAQLVSRYEK